ncbi:MAG: M48 family metallopeptidase [Patescibacteria group bacterium]|jgi:Zn-dependent protease with chaperone function
MEENNHIKSNVESWMFRVPNENVFLIFSVTALLAFGIAFSLLNIYIFAFLLLSAVVFIRLHQAQYLGNSVRVHSSQFPEIYQIFKEYVIRLGITKAALYIKQDPYLQAYTLGINNCTVILTSSLVEQLSKEELNFVIAHELGHFKARHTLISTFINPLGVNNVLGNFIFSFWNRKAEYSCDRCGLILTKDINAAVSSLLKLSIGANLYKDFNLQGYIAQIRKAESKQVKLSEVVIDHPLITNRIKSLILFWKENFVKLS